MFRKVAKIGVLLGIKESYLLAKNTYGLGVHPFKTLKSLGREKDRSQQLLILGWPVYVLVFGAGFIWLGRRLLASGAAWGWGARAAAMMFLGFSFSFLVYLLFWQMRVWLKK